MSLSKEKIVTLMKYLSATKDRLVSAVPEKHQGHPEAYRKFLEREILIVQAKLDADKLEGVK